MKVTGLHELEPSHLALFHGFNLPLLLTFISICAGVALFYFGCTTNWRWTSIPRFLRFDEFFESSLIGVTRTSMSITRLSGFDRPTIYLFVIIGFSLIFIGIFTFPFLHKPADSCSSERSHFRRSGSPKQSF